MFINPGRAAARALTSSLSRPSSQLPLGLSRVLTTSLPHRFRRERVAANLASASPFSVIRRTYATDEAKPKRTRAAPKTGAKKSTTKKTAVKRKMKGKKKTTATEKKKKAAPKPKKKVLTAEERKKAVAAKAEKAEKAKVKAFKAAVLMPPKALPQTAFTVILSELGKVAHGIQGAEASAKLKALSPSELEHYNHVANQNKIANETAYKRWVESYTPVQIYENNNARRYLWRLKGSPKYRLRLVKDERQPKKFTSAFIDFSVERHRSGDLKHMSLGDAARLVGQEWKSLNDADKKRYQAIEARDRTRYEQEMKTVLNRDVDYSRSSSP